MEALPKADVAKLVSDSLKEYNSYAANARKSTEELLKTIVIVNGGLLTLSVGAVLSRAGANIPSDQMATLQWSWGLLFGSIVLALTMMLGMQFAMYTVHRAWRANLTEGALTSVRFLAAPNALRLINASVGVLSLLFCIGGIGCMGAVANGVAKSLGHGLPAVG